MKDEEPIEVLAELRDAGPGPAAERRIVDGARTLTRRRSATPWVFAGVGVATACAAAVTLLWASPAPPAPPAPTPPVVAAPAAPVTIPEPTAMAVGSHRVVPGDGAQVEVRSNAPDRVELELMGRATFAVEKLPPGGSFRVQTAHALVEVVGTRFAVDAGEDCTTVSVEEGRVRVTGETSRLLSPGESTRVCRVEPAGAPELADLRVALQLIDEGGALDEAARRLRRYADRHPDGALLEEALFHLSLVELRQGRRDAAVDAGRRFLGRFPESRRAATLRARLPELGGP